MSEKKQELNSIEVIGIGGGERERRECSLSPGKEKQSANERERRGEGRDASTFEQPAGRRAEQFVCHSSGAKEGAY